MRMLQAAAFGMQYAVRCRHHATMATDHTYRSFAHERVLTSQEVVLIDDWVNNGMPQGSGYYANGSIVYLSNEVITNRVAWYCHASYTVNTAVMMYTGVLWIQQD